MSSYSSLLLLKPSCIGLNGHSLIFRLICSLFFPSLSLQCLSVCVISLLLEPIRQQPVKALFDTPSARIVFVCVQEHAAAGNNKLCCTSLDTLKRSCSLALFHIKHSTNFETGQGDTDDQGTVKCLLQARLSPKVEHTVAVI